MALGTQKDYPYMYARVSAKKAKLLDQSDYENLMKMGANEISRNLQEGEYKEDIDALGSNYEGVRLVELGLSRNLARSLSEIVDLAPEGLSKVLQAYLRKYDILSIKRLLRWKLSENEDLDIQAILTPVSSFTYKDLKELSEMEFEQIIEEISFESVINYTEYLEDAETVSEVETALDQAYFDELEYLAKKVNSKEFKDFLKREMEHQNLTVALRLKKHEVEKEEIRSRMIENGGSKIVENVIEAEDLEAAVNTLAEEEMISSTDEELEEIERELEVNRLQRALRMLHTEPLGLTSIIGYIIAKITEVENLRMLIRAKETGIHNIETIRRNLVVSER
ncbi:V-type ATPase subunit [Candidatus Nanohalovita haloferacivicina]|uniref:V-type ATPase subunit n=1 Tax=Candidatus Nanohalovita haloferacivicina TaxID=2978046 RepID=UPI00325FB097|nr:V/A-type H /Na -transporting ATPase subunit C [Candidatus Nanohalobia archaeon BNXNv]